LLGVAGPPATIGVPRLVDLTSSEARSRLRDLGLRFTQRPIESARPKGTVVAQSPRPGTRLREGQSVTLTVSTGPARVTVPDVIGLDERTARDELMAAGLEVEVVEEATDALEEDGVVLGQDPAGGASRAKGSVVTITVGLFS
jgi:serine/threonine-protein kinase